MKLSEFYEKNLKSKEDFHKFIYIFLENIMPKHIDIEKYTKSAIEYLFYDKQDFLYKLKYSTFRQVNSDYLDNLFKSFQNENLEWVNCIWDCAKDKKEAKTVLAYLGNKKVEILRTITIPSFKSLENDVKNSEIVTNMLNSIVEHLQQMRKNQNIMLANISHEMRTPLNSVIGYLDILEAINNLSQEDRKNITYAKNSSKLLLTLINDLLDTQKLSNATLDLVNNPFWVNKVIKNAVLISSINAKQKNIEFTFIDNSTIFSEVIGDKNRFLQILNNLFSNAIKFTPQKGKVKVIVNSEEFEDSVKIDIKVKDTGIGIDKNKQKELFKPFSRATNKERGTGLGLYISKQLAQRMGGNIWFDSCEGKGSTFYVEIEFKKSNNFYDKDVLRNRNIVFFNENQNRYCEIMKTQLELSGAKVKMVKELDKFMNYLLVNKKIDMAIIIYPNKLEEDKLDESFIKTYKKLNENSKIKTLFIAGVTEDYYPKNSEIFDKIIHTPVTILDVVEIFEKKVTKSNNYKYLIIDDEPMNRLVLSTMLQTIDKTSYIDTANNGIEGLEKLKNNFYDIIFLDKRMPKMDGYEVLEHLKDLDIKSKIYLLTADGDSETIQKTKEYKVGYIAKPVTISTLHSVISEHQKE